MTNRDRIVVLLERWRDVLPGLVDTDGGSCSRTASVCSKHLDGRGNPLCPRFGCVEAGGYALFASGAWKHGSYRTLEALVAQMRREEGRLARHLLRRYLHFTEVRRALCRKCGLHPAAHIGRVHSHPPGRAVSLVPVIARLAPDDVSEAAVEKAIDWLESRWPGEVSLPGELVRGAHAVTSATVPARSATPARIQVVARQESER